MFLKSRNNLNLTFYSYSVTGTIDFLINYFWISPHSIIHCYWAPGCYRPSLSWEEIRSIVMRYNNQETILEMFLSPGYVFPVYLPPLCWCLYAPSSVLYDSTFHYKDSSHNITVNVQLTSCQPLCSRSKGSSSRWSARRCTGMWWTSSGLTSSQPSRYLDLWAWRDSASWTNMSSLRPSARTAAWRPWIGAATCWRWGSATSRPSTAGSPGWRTGSSRQSGDLSLVQILPDTVLSLVELNAPNRGF